MIEQAIRDRYFELVKAYIARQEEEQLARAAQLGRDFAGAGILPDAIIELHNGALRRLAEEAPGTMLLAAVLPASALVTEVFTAHSQAFHERHEHLQEEPSEREKVEERLRESDERYRTLFQLSRDAIYLVKPDGIFIEVNQAWLDLLGCSPEDVAKFDAAHWYADPDDRARFRERMAAAGDMLDDEVQLRRKDGTVFDCQRRNVVQRDEYGNIRAFQGVMRDVTEMRNAERALRKSEEKYRSLFEQSRDAIYMSPREGRFIDANQAMLDLFGYTRDEMLETDARDIYVEPADRDRFLQEIEQKESVLDYEVRFRKKDGRLMDCLLTATLRRAEDGSILGYQGIIRDISESKRAEERLERSFVDLAETISRAEAYRDPYSSSHQRRVAQLVRAVGEKMGLDRDRLLGLEIGGLLHDIGKVSIPESILNKPGKLTQEEWSLVRLHARRGYEIFQGSNLPWPVAEMALHHHERLDGSGYPDGIGGDELSLETRILAVCNVAEAMSAHRPYRPARSRAEIVEELRDGRGRRYDARVVDILLEMADAGALEADSLQT